MQTLRMHAHSTVSRTHMHTVLALKFNAGGNYELLPQVSDEKLLGTVHFVTVVACNRSSSLLSKCSLVSALRALHEVICSAVKVFYSSSLVTINQRSAFPVTHFLGE